MDRDCSGFADSGSFTYDYFRELVCRFLQDYRFTTFEEGRRIVSATERPLLIMRHDIDMDLDAALTMAVIERDLGIRSTYFFMVSSQLYNVFTRRGRSMVHQILDCGHHFGLHFDCAVYEDISASNLNGYVATECSLLEGVFHQAVEAVTFHRPGPLELSDVKLDSLPHCYELVFREAFEYFADSRGVWARGNPIESEAYALRKNFHICIHPIWWNPEARDRVACLSDLLDRFGAQADDYLARNCQVWDQRQRAGGYKPSK